MKFHFVVKREERLTWIIDAPDVNEAKQQFDALVEVEGDDSANDSNIVGAR